MDNLEKNLDFFPNVLYEAGQIFLEAQRFQQSPNKYLKKHTDVKNRRRQTQEKQNLVFKKISKKWELVRKDNRDPLNRVHSGYTDFLNQNFGNMQPKTDSQ
jgi:hypothetical protein